MPDLPLRIVVVGPPEGVDYGLQRGAGSAYETVQTQRARGGDLAFDFTVEVRESGARRFAGPFVQGPPAAPFVYIDIGTYAGQKTASPSGRLKIPLDIPPALARAGGPLEARVPGAGKDGGRRFATVKPPEGWRAVPG